MSVYKLTLSDQAQVTLQRRVSFSDLAFMWLIDIPLCRRCGTREEALAHVLCQCDTLATFRHSYLVSYILDPEDVKSEAGGNLEVINL